MKPQYRNDAHITPAETAHLREVLDLRIKVVEERLAALQESLGLRIDSAVTLSTEKFRARDEALVIRAEQTEDHLVKLNGEASRLLSAISEMEEKYVSALAYEPWKKIVEAELNEWRAFQGRYGGKSNAIAQMISISLSVLAIVAVLLKVLI